MKTTASRHHDLLDRIVRRIDRKATFQVGSRSDGDIELQLHSGRLNAKTQISPAALDAAAGDVVQFETLRGKIKRVYDRMRAPAPPPKMPRVEIQKDLAFSFRPGNRGRR